MPTTATRSMCSASSALSTAVANPSRVGSASGGAGESPQPHTSGRMQRMPSDSAATWWSHSEASRVNAWRKSTASPVPESWMAGSISVGRTLSFGADHERGEILVEGRRLDMRARVLLHVAQLENLAGRDQRDRNACPTGSSRPADAVQVFVGGERAVVVDHVRDV